MYVLTGSRRASARAGGAALLSCAAIGAAIGVATPAAASDVSVSLGGRLNSAPAAAATADSRRYLVAAAGTDGHVNYRVDTDGSWGPWTWTDGVVSSAPSVVAVGGLFTMFARGTDNALIVRRETTAGSWGSWRRIGGALHEAPSAVTGGAGVSAVMLGTDDHVWKAASTDGGVSWSWAMLGGQTLTARPTAAWSGGVLHVFARGDVDGGSRNVLLHQVWGAGWDNLGGTLGSAPTVTLCGSALRVYAAGTDGRLFGLWWIGPDSTWRAVGGAAALTSDPAATGRSHSAYVFWRGTAGDLRQFHDGFPT